MSLGCWRRRSRSTLLFTPCLLGAALLMNRLGLSLRRPAGPLAILCQPRTAQQPEEPAWHLTGQLIEACSCKALCPCVLGSAEPDQGWCSGALTFVVQEGASDGVNLGGRKVVWLIDLPKDFLSGNGTVRIYIDDGADTRQRQELEAIFTGEKGGLGKSSEASSASGYRPRPRRSPSRRETTHRSRSARRVT
jgi:hypothetical protein